MLRLFLASTSTRTVVRAGDLDDNGVTEETVSFNFGSDARVVASIRPKGRAQRLLLLELPAASVRALIQANPGATDLGDAESADLVGSLSAADRDQLVASFDSMGLAFDAAKWTRIEGLSCAELWRRTLDKTWPSGKRLDLVELKRRRDRNRGTFYVLDLQLSDARRI